VVDGYGNVDLTGAVFSGISYFDPTHSLTTSTETAFLWQLTQP
jgi:hypothetical protein